MNKNNLLLATFLCLFSITSSLGQDSPLVNMSQKEKEELFAKKVIERIHDLEHKIKIISDKSQQDDRQIEAINVAVEYFMSKDNIVQVSSKNPNRPIRSFKVRTYLNNVRVLKYSKVNIEWYNAIWVNQIRKGADGKYYGTVRVYQKFEGYGTDNRLKYTDITYKDIEVQLEVLKVDTGSVKKEILRVLLGDLRVTNTR